MKHTWQILIVCLSWLVATKSIAFASQQEWKGDGRPLQVAWTFHPFMLLKPGDPFEGGEVVHLPHLWKTSGHAVGFATYRTVFSIPAGFVGESLALLVPDMYSSYKLWINGSLYSENGQVGTDEQHSEPYWHPRVITFVPLQPSVEIIIQVSNFHHHRGGIGKELIMDTAPDLLAWWEQNKWLGTVLFIGLFMLGLAGLMISLYVQEPTFLYFALFSFFWALRSAFSNDYLAVQYFPDLSWYLVVRIEYFTIFLTTGCAFLFVSRYYHFKTNFLVNAFYVAGSLVFTALTLLTKPIQFTEFINLYLGFSLSLIVGVLIFVIKAFISDKPVSTWLLGIAFIGALLFGYVIIAYSGLVVFNRLIYNVGFLLLFMSIAYTLFVQFLGRKSLKEVSGKIQEPGHS